MLSALYTLYSSINGETSGDWGMFHLVLDMLIRRNIITCQSAMSWLIGRAEDSLYLQGIPVMFIGEYKNGLLLQIINTNLSTANGGTLGHTSVWDHVLMITDRNFDFVVAAITKKEQLLAEIDTCNNKIDDNYKQLQAIGDAPVSAHEHEDALALAATQVDDGSDDEGDRVDSKRRRGGDDADANESVVVIKEHHTSDQVSREEISATIEALQAQLSTAMATLDVISTALTASITASKEMYVLIVGQVIRVIGEHYASLVNNEVENLHLDAKLITLRSLLKALLRTFEYNQIQVSSVTTSSTNGKEFILTDRAAVDTMSGSQGLLVSCPAVQGLWAQYA